MTDLISRQAAIEAIRALTHLYGNKEQRARVGGYADAAMAIRNLPTIDHLPVTRCKDCKHRPIDTVGKGYGEDLSFDDDYKCPCRCEDPFYSWMPFDDWFCANGERRDDD